MKRLTRVTSTIVLAALTPRALDPLWIRALHIATYAVICGMCLWLIGMVLPPSGSTLSLVIAGILGGLGVYCLLVISEGTRYSPPRRRRYYNLEEHRWETLTRR